MTTIVDRTRELCDELVALNQKLSIDYGDIERMDECLGELYSLQNALFTMLDIDTVDTYKKEWEVADEPC